MTHTQLLVATALTALLSLASIAKADQHALANTVSPTVSSNVSILKFDSVTLHTFQGVSNSHIIETKNELRLIDAQMTQSSATELSEYIDSLKKPLVALILSHNHPDHWFGASVFEAKGTPVLTSKNILQDLAMGGQRYIDVLSGKLGKEAPSKVIRPSNFLTLGAQTWDGLSITLEELPDQEAHHSLLVKIPEAKVLIGQDLFYNNMFLVASERSRNQNWIHHLQQLQVNESSHYNTLLVGHGKNGGFEIVQQDIEYLTFLGELLEKNLSQDATREAMIQRFPHYKAKTMLDISMRNLFNAH